MATNEVLTLLRRLLVLSVCQFSLAAAAADSGPLGQAGSDSGAMASAASGRNKGALYKVTREGQVAYLFGTIHAGEASLYPLAPEIARALAGADELVLELDTRDDAAFQRALSAHARYAPGDDIGKHVAAATLARLDAALQGHGIALSNVDQLKPWLLANYLMGLDLQRGGLLRTQGNEFFLLEQVKPRGTAVSELESADYQLALFNTMGEAEAERYLIEALDQLADGRSLRSAKATIAAWRSGDAAALDAVMSDAVQGGTVMGEFTRRMLLGKRNPEMAQRIAQLMKPGKTAFVGVGLLHLLGAEGVPRLLAQRGFTVQRVD
jgi:uncharacterized protein YbaP (TraB family)